MTIQLHPGAVWIPAQVYGCISMCFSEKVKIYESLVHLWYIEGDVQDWWGFERSGPKKLLRD